MNDFILFFCFLLFSIVFFFIYIQSHNPGLINRKMTNSVLGWIFTSNTNSIFNHLLGCESLNIHTVVFGVICTISWNVNVHFKRILQPFGPTAMHVKQFLLRPQRSFTKWRWIWRCPDLRSACTPRTSWSTSPHRCWCHRRHHHPDCWAGELSCSCA